jgi:hypothetical protein
MRYRDPESDYRAAAIRAIRRACYPREALSVLVLLAVVGCVCVSSKPRDAAETSAPTSGDNRFMVALKHAAAQPVNASHLLPRPTAVPEAISWRHCASRIQAPLTGHFALAVHFSANAVSQR